MTTSKEVLNAYNWFLGLNYTVKKVQDLGSEWGDIVKANQDKFEIGRSDNGYFKVVNYEDFEPDWSINDWKPEIEGYELIRDFYFGKNYYLFKKIDETSNNLSKSSQMPYTYEVYTTKDGKQIKVQKTIEPVAIQSEPFVKLEGTESKLTLYTPGTAIFDTANSGIYVVEDPGQSENIISQIRKDGAKESKQFPVESVNEYAGVINGKYQLHLIDEQDGFHEINIKINGKYEMHQLMNRYFFIKVEHKSEPDLDWL